jgi:histidinol-phosphate aminotransferase
VSDDWIAALVHPELHSAPVFALPDYTGVRARLDANELPYTLDVDIAVELGRVLAGVATNRYPDPTAGKLRHVISAELGVAPNQLVFGNGSLDLVMCLIAAFSRPRSPAAVRARVLIPTPSFVGYTMAARSQNADVVAVPLRDDFGLDLPALDHAFETQQPNVVFLARPHNPSGTMWPRADIEHVLSRHRDTVIVLDEAYIDYAGTHDTLLDLLPRFRNLVIMRTLSKLGLAAVRVGYIAGSPELVVHVDKARSPFNVGAFNQAAGAWLLTHHRERLRAKLEIVIREREQLARELAEISDLYVFPSRASFVLCRYGKPGEGRSEQVCAHLARHGVLVNAYAGSGPLASCFRVTVGTRDENTLLIEALRAYETE